MRCWTCLPSKFEELSLKVEQLDSNQQEAIKPRFSEKDLQPAVDIWQGKYFHEPFLDEPSDDFEPQRDAFQIHLGSYMYGKFGPEQRREMQQAFLATLAKVGEG